MAFGSPISHQDELKSDINMIPFIDVMLVLLIIFMLTVPVVTQKLTIDLPHANSSQLNTSSESIYIEVQANQQLLVDGRIMPANQLVSYLKTKSSDAPIKIAGDREVNYEAVVQILAQLQAAGLTQIELITRTP